MQNQKELTEIIAAEKPQNLVREKLNFWQLWNMNLGFLGIQFGWGLQMANMSAIFEYLGANAHQLPLLWLAAPVTGLIVQPIIGNLSDYTWTVIGRRRPYFLLGAILAFIALVLMPRCSTLLGAAGLLWLLDTSNNMSMVPFRAFVGDLLPIEQRTVGFALQSVMVGIGAIAASTLPWILNHFFAVNNLSYPSHLIPLTIEISFYAGAVVFLGTILWTVVTTPEYPPQNEAKFEQLQETRGGILNSLQETWETLQEIPPKMKQLARVQFCSWLGAFCFFLYFPPAVAHDVFGAVSRHSALYSNGIEWAGLCFALYNGVCIGFSFLLPRLAKRFERSLIHGICLLCGGISLITIWVIPNQYFLLVVMLGWGIAWSSMLTMPYAMLSSSIPPQRRGIYQGIFNFYIVLPEIAIALGFGWVMSHFLDDNCLLAVLVGGVFLIVAAILTQFIESNDD
ncbi:Major facilitator superfamily MFS_1 [Hyella patelloides LEGE 07179]|uniref:Major facilitator superfamily MFS_1 n=1 Tax=Hyella patelloides LEGE 07179 TaxID=945734 RepID=A0A563VNJ2_9CYAN|nr:MFS transporter [Hyella patelloides]VEP13036.1 Major facilitator superfamily MFS_1 [Hyella patelloides LEGE 07179]